MKETLCDGNTVALYTGLRTLPRQLSIIVVNGSPELLAYDVTDQKFFGKRQE
jgi:hypothetical protein